MLKKLLIVAIILTSNFGFSAISEAAQYDSENYCGRNCYNDSYCGDYYNDGNCNGDYCGYGRGRGCR